MATVAMGVPAHEASHHTALRVTTVVAASIAAVLVTAAMWLWNAPFATTTPSESVSEALAEAAAAQESFHDLHGGYTVDPGALIQAGWVPTNDVDVVLVSAASDAFCLAAGPAGKEPVAWFTHNWEQLDHPCE
ncbi:hypothetical protein OEB99_13160 [Actinotalea sp. M2MS4P-6]|uniref:hypothetical protein n=1 Tax=Actinotalea sp. M2MS4P-6 TaxID=2983762 RepID=UPI0021E3CCEA|nr:hypothetical protein [Actinotalea sp. M2MS4P-6]MCV2395261.1 hypothetical protein [Actinotalea sp. M2MS4P-6]